MWTSIETRTEFRIVLPFDKNGLGEYYLAMSAMYAVKIMMEMLMPPIMG